MHVADINVEFSHLKTYIDEKIFVVPGGHATLIALSVSHDADLLHQVRDPSRLGEAGYIRSSRVRYVLEKSK